MDLGVPQDVKRDEGAGKVVSGKGWSLLLVDGENRREMSEMR